MVLHFKRMKYLIFSIMPLILIIVLSLGQNSAEYDTNFENNNILIINNTEIPIASAIPTDPGALYSSTVPEGGYTQSSSITIVWVPSSGVDFGDEYVANWTNSPIPPTINASLGPNTEQNKSFVDDLENGTYWCHVWARDIYYPANVSNIVTYGPFYVDTTAPTNPTGGSSSSHTTMIWSNNDEINYTWTGANDIGSGIQGYSFEVLTYDPGSPLQILDTTTNTYNYTVSSSGEYKYYINTQDNVGNWGTSNFQSSETFRVDITNPTTPSSVNLNTTGDWYDYNVVVNATWASNDGHSGIDGYSVLWSQNSGDTPDDIKDYEQDFQWVLSSDSVTLTTGLWYLHVKALDNAGNWGDTYHSSPIRVDTVLPTNPSIDNSTHDTSTWYTDTSLTLDWQGAIDDDSSIAGYYYTLDKISNTEVDDMYSYKTGTVHSTTFGSDGLWYFHIKAKDNAGNLAADTVHYGPMKIDTLNPTNPSSVFVDYGDIGDWTDNNTFFVYWEGFSDSGSGVDGFAYIWDNIADTSISPTIINSTANSTFAPNLTQSGSWYLHLKTLDNSGKWSTNTRHFGPFKVDLYEPVNPTVVTCINANPSDWDNNDYLSFTWNVGTDTGGSGIAGYSLLLDDNPSSIPDNNINETSPSYASGTLADGIYYFHLRTIDNVGNMSSVTLHYGPYLLDSTDPNNPLNSSLISTSGHVVNDWSLDNTITIQWDVGTDTTSYIDGYSYIWTQNINDVPDFTIESNTTSATSGALTDGDWYFILISRDNATNWNTTFISKIGPFRIDTALPSNPTGYSANATTSDWIKDHFVQVSWSGASDGSGSGIAGYALLWSQTEGTRPDEIITTVGPSNISYYLDSGIWYLNIITVDDLDQWSSTVYTIGPFKIDDTAPDLNPTVIISSSHPLTSTWYYGVDITITWSGAHDELTSYLNYSWLIDSDPYTDLTSFEYTTDQDNIYQTVGGTGVYYFHIICGDMADNWNYTTQHYGPIWIDRTVPTNPNEIVYTSPAIGAYSDGSDIDVRWTGAIDDDCGTLIYAYEWLNVPALPALTETETYDYLNDTVLGEGTWYLCIRTGDSPNGGNNWNNTFFAIGPFHVDKSAPDAVSILTMTANHTVDVWDADSLDQYIRIDWLEPSDNPSVNNSGVKEYWVLWDNNPSGIPLGVYKTTSLFNISNLLTDRIDWYFHIKTVDYMNLESGITHYGPFRIDTTSPTGVSSINSNHTSTGGTWNDDCFSAFIRIYNLLGQNDVGSGIDGFSYLFSMNPLDEAPGYKMVEEDVIEIISNELLTTGTWYIHIRTFDNLGLNSSTFHSIGWNIDVTAPDNPDSYTCPTHNIEEWGSSTTLTLNLIGASDDGIGQYYYYIFFDSNPTASGIPSDFNWIFGNTYNNFSMEQGIHYVHIMAGDYKSGSVPVHWNGTWYNIGPFMIDSNNPTNPTIISSTINEDEWTNTTSISINFLDASGTGSPIYGYSYSWSTISGINPDTTVDILGESFNNNSLDEGIYYLAVRFMDNASNWDTNTVQFGPFMIIRTLPESTYSFPQTPEANGWYFHTPYITFSEATSDVSGIYGIIYRFNGGEWMVHSNLGATLGVPDGNQFLEYYIKDNAGYNESIKSMTFKVDSTDPVIQKNKITIPFSGELPPSTLNFTISIDLSAETGITSVTLYVTKDGQIIEEINCIESEIDSGIYKADINVSEYQSGSYGISVNITSISTRNTYLADAGVFTILENNNSMIVFIILGIIGAVVGGILIKVLKPKNTISPSTTKRESVKLSKPVEFVDAKAIDKIQKKFNTNSKDVGTNAKIGWKEDQKVDAIREILRQQKLNKLNIKTNKDSSISANLTSTLGKPDSILWEKPVYSEEEKEDLFNEKKDLIQEKEERFDEKKDEIKPILKEVSPRNLPKTQKTKMNLFYCEQCGYKIEQDLDIDTGTICPKCNNSMNILFKCDKCGEFYTLEKIQVLDAGNHDIMCPTCGDVPIKPVKPNEL